MTTTDELATHMPFLLARARRLTRNEVDARDLAQDTCLSALEALTRMDQLPPNMRGWLTIIMRNTWLNDIRHRRVRFAARAEAATSTVDSSLVETRASYAQFARAWSGISPTARRIAERCLLEGESYDVVSASMGVATGTIKTSIHRTRRHLEQAMFGSGLA